MTQPIAKTPSSDRGTEPKEQIAHFRIFAYLNYGERSIFNLIFDSSSVKCIAKISLMQPAIYPYKFWDYPRFTQADNDTLHRQVANTVSTQQHIYLSDLCTDGELEECGVAISVYAINYKNSKEEVFTLKQQNYFRAYSTEEQISEWVQAPHAHTVKNFRIESRTTQIKYSNVVVDGCYDEDSSQPVACSVAVCFFNQSQALTCAYNIILNQQFQNQNINITLISVLATEVYNFHNTSFTIKWNTQSQIRELRAGSNEIMVDRHLSFFLQKDNKPDVQFAFGRTQFDLTYYLNFCPGGSISQCDVPSETSYKQKITYARNTELKRDLSDICQNCIVVVTAHKRTAPDQQLPARQNISIKIYYKF